VRALAFTTKENEMSTKLRFKRKIMDENGTKFYVIVDLIEQTVEYLRGDRPPLSIPADQYEYRYSHGGASYRAAIEAYWDAESENWNAIENYTAANTTI
jgi:hypothetical protein